MNNVRLIWSLVGLSLLMTSQTFGQTNTYTYDPSEEVISNPERGLFVYGGDEIDHSTGCWWNRKERFDSYLQSLADGRSKGMTLVYLQYDLGAYRNTSQPIPQSYFQCLDKDFAAAEERGFKVILRFSYNWRKNEAGEYYDDFENKKLNPNPCRSKVSESNLCEASVAQVLKHLGQSEFSDFIQKNARLISVWQAGFLGKYGEWYYTSEETGIQDGSKMKARLPILKRMLEMLPYGTIQVRTPFYKEYAIRALPDKTAGDKNVIRDFKERIGVYDDSFFDDDKYSTFASYGDGASESKAFWKNYLANENTHVAVGGETSSYVIVKKPKSDADMKRIFDEFGKYHWSFFNYAKLTKKLGDMNWTYLYDDKESRIRKLLGYRLYLTQTEFDGQAQKGGDIAIKFTLANSGFAAPYSNRQIGILACRKDSTVCKVDEHSIGKPDVAPDMRTWLPGKPISFSASLSIKALEPGEYDLYIRFADRDSNMAQRDVFSIRLANLSKAKKNGSMVLDAFAWNASLGANKFGTVVIN
jgi:hypothetical protein